LRERWRVEQLFGRGREQLPELQQRREERGLKKMGEKRRKEGEREKVDHGNERREKNKIKA
jgi:hypothetical protein